ncbi:MAG: hypothetical protein JSV00_07805 [bacterium]|nr:MAG: hypothetical protein JSV00_07805 [bacterium]
MLRDYFADGVLPEVIRGSVTRRIMVLGGTDTGKTTLVEDLANHLSREGPVALVDLDVGQSTVGPPTTVAWTLVEGGFPGRGLLQAGEMAFVGSLSPRGNLLPALSGAARMVFSAAAACPRILIDTSGFIEEPAGAVFKQHKVDLLQPDLVIALQQTEELEPILHSFSHQTRPAVLRLSVPPGVRKRDPEERAAWRRERFAAYFGKAVLREVSLSSVGLRVTRELADLSNFALRNRIVSLRDDGGRDLALGVIVEVARKQGNLVIRTPLDGNTPISTVVIGEALSPL